ncbi:efflux RND transporter permease subunit [uncultured Sphaerochaeta sp.]|uniref:efflux RND transporter permease subunit n=1 Tax=uncultured Sphaerochaeta sp. TaxID=886478 RepID=UPI002A0A8A0F|nr:efflux RND transporter permease subunit [uncultured Sphaerochaeta sp.]
MKLSELSVRRPVLITMVYVLLLVIAAIFVSRINIALYPSVDMPIISVRVNCNDVGPEEIELQVARVLENSLGSVENLNTMTSESSTGEARLVLEFDYGTDLDQAETDVTRLINLLTDSLPSWADAPQVMQLDITSLSSLMTLVISGSSDKSALKSVADDTASPLLLRIKGVSTVDVAGTGTRIYTVKVDPIKLASYNLTLTNVKTALANRNIQGTNGTITQNDIDYSVTLDGRYFTISDIESTVITTLDGVPIHVRDIGSSQVDTERSFKERYLDGSSVVTLSVNNDSNSNATTVANAVRAALPSINSALPSGMKLTIQEDTTTMITSTLNEVYKSAIEGIILAALVIFLFLRNLKATLIISLSMPISLLLTMMVMSMFNITLNSMSLSGLILGIGMIVDASVIILENTYNYRQKGHGTAASAILGSENMSTAIIASTLTTLCVFIPLFIFKNNLEMIGIMFQDLIITVCIAMIASLFVALTLVPALTGSILRLDTRVQKPLRFKPLKWMDSVYLRFEQKLQNAYAKALGYFLSNRLLLVLLLALLLIFSFQHFSGIGISLTPSMNSDDSVTLNLTLPAGTTKSATRSELFALQSELAKALPLDSYTQIMINVGKTNTGSMVISLPDVSEQKYSATDIKNLVRPLLNSNPSATWTFGGGRGPGNSTPIEISITGSNISDITETTNSIASIINSFVPEATNVSTDLEDGSPKINIVIDKEVANDLGVSMETINTAVTDALAGTTATTLSTFSSDATYDLDVEMNPTSMQTANDLSNLLIDTPNGTVRLDSIATFTNSKAPQTITRKNKERVNKVTASLADGYSANQVQAKIQTALDENLLIPEGVTVNESGDMQQFATYGPTLVMIIILALLLVFAVMAAQFESLVDPFIIFATIPLLLIGVIFIHLVMGQDFTLFSIVGIIALIGVVVNNGIVLVDSINQLVAKRVPVKEACLTAARTRLRPILMTTLTTVLGMIPLAFFPGSGAEMMQPIAVTFVGGLLTGSFLTLFLSPVLYSIFNKRRERNFDNPNTLANQLELFDKEGR